MKSLKVIVTAVVFLFLAASFWFYTRSSRHTEQALSIRVSDSSVPNNYELVKKLTGRDVLEEEKVVLTPITI
jgi:hypothetical protein